MLYLSGKRGEQPIGQEGSSVWGLGHSGERKALQSSRSPGELCVGAHRRATFLDVGSVYAAMCCPPAHRVCLSDAIVPSTYVVLGWRSRYVCLCE